MASASTASLARAVAACSARPPPTEARRGQAADHVDAKGANRDAPISISISLSLSLSSSAAAAASADAVSRRYGLSACFLTFLAFSSSSSSSSSARAAILEADDDEQLLERVKQDRKIRLQRQGVISSSGEETGYLQELVYKLSKVGQAIENDDLPAASSVLGPNADAEWVQQVNTAFMKLLIRFPYQLSSSPEEKVEVETFNSSLASLFTSVGKRDVESSKMAFVSSAAALEKWIGLTGLVSQLKGL
ncbi:thylakoid lumenal 16.5 kDa protein, chloroplastic isoform X1 [Ananas comosus]|uniref:Thylakoid lumenal 16.5 kDa protein, chloroplastic isoform X1 n=1 Tax=Ananas comosus TaxID=4615 RepID=A0A6P5FSP8_ANACO|nr:thylakoid lumenal 16.5 kDa protein, chloroplastic isoform X1 [Ananas comosus]